MANDELILYPSNWLYNAGVIGLLDVQENANEDVEKSLCTDGTYRLSTDYFDGMMTGKRTLSKAIISLSKRLVSDDELRKWLHPEGGVDTRQKKRRKAKTEEQKPKQDNMLKYKRFQKELGDFGYNYIRAGNKLFASKTPYQNLVQLSEWQSYEFSNIVQQIPSLVSTITQEKCDLCRENSVVITNQGSKLQMRLSKLQSSHLKGLGPSFGEFPNGFWNMNQSMKLCPLCCFLIIHHHLAFTRTSDGSEIFINAPSFRVMYELNKLARKAYGTSSTSDNLSQRNLLAMSVIEYVMTMKANLSVWTGLNLEIITKRGNDIGFFSLPYDVIKIISDRSIAAQLSDIGEFRILDLVLNREYSRFLELAYRLIRGSLKEKWWENKPFKDFVYAHVFRDENKRDPFALGQKILKLYTLIEQRRRYNYAD